MNRLLLAAISLASAAVLGTLLWLLFRFLGGDRAAILGALAIGFLPLVVIVLYGSWLWERHPDTRGMEVDELHAYFFEHIYPRIRDYVAPVVFTHMVLTGTWIGLCANHPVILAVLYYAIWLLTVSAVDGSPSRSGMFRSAVTLVASAVFGAGLKHLLLQGS